MTPLEQSMEDDRKELEGKPEEKDGLEKIIDKATAKDEEPENDKQKEDGPDSEEDEEDDDATGEELDKAAKPAEHPAKARITAREEREARIRAEVAAAELRGRIAAQEEFKRAQEQNRNQNQEHKIPDPDLEPEAYAQYQFSQTRGDIDHIARWSKEQMTNLAAQQLSMMADLAETKTMQADAEYLPAKEFLVSRQHAMLKHQHGQQLQMQYPSATPAQIDQYLKQYASSQVEQQVVATVQQRGDLSKSIKELAELYGYSPQAREQGLDQKKTEYKPNLQNIKKNMGKSAHLMGGSARGKSGSPSAEQLVDAALSDLLSVQSKEFDDALSIH